MYWQSGIQITFLQRQIFSAVNLDADYIYHTLQDCCKPLTIQFLGQVAGTDSIRKQTNKQTKRTILKVIIWLV